MSKVFPRRKPFSGKQKKQQLKDKKLRWQEKREQDRLEEDREDCEARPQQEDVAVVPGVDRTNTYTRKVLSVNQQPGARGGGRNKYNLQFSKEKLDAEFDRSKQEMHIEVSESDPASLEYTSQQFFPDGLTYPDRPPGYRDMTKAQLDQHENKSVRVFGEQMYTLFCEQDINLYEQNVETWKQLWRVFDKSNVLLFIVDIRFTVCQFPPYVYQRLSSQGRGVVLVLNKVDLVSASLVLAWQRYFTDLCPGIEVVPFCSHESILDRRRKIRMALHSCRALVAAVERVGGVRLSSWREQLELEAAQHEGATCLVGDQDLKEHLSDDCSDDDDGLKEAPPEGDSHESDTECSSNNKRAFTIGTIGYPNVGKSSLINAIMGKYKVSVHSTPGHTKHFQTHYLTADVMLCDCPGLVFPSICPYKLQVLSGTFPISQVRGPMAVIRFLATNINVPRAMGLTFPPDYKQDQHDIPKWTPYIIAEAWAQKRHYNIRGKGGRLDSSRAANEIMRLSLAAKKSLVLSLKPTDYCVNRDIFEKCEEIQGIRLVQGVHATQVDIQERVLSFASIPRGTKLGSEHIVPNQRVKKKKNFTTKAPLHLSDEETDTFSEYSDDED